MFTVPLGVVEVCQAGTSRTQPPSNSTVPPRFGFATFSTPSLLELAGDLDDRHGLGAGALGDVHHVAVVVRVAVGEEDVRRLELGRLDGRLRDCR